MSKNANFSRISMCQWGQSDYISVILLQFLLQGYWQRTKNYTDRQKSRPIYRSTIGRLSTDISNSYLLTIDHSVDRPSTECWPITDQYIGQVSTNYRRSFGKKSAKCRWMKSYIGRDTSGTTIDRVSTECRPTIDRLSNECRPSVDRLSTECRPTIDRVSTDYWPSVDRFIDRYIDRYLGRHYPQYTRSGILISAKIASLQLGCEVLRSDLILNSNLSNKWRPPPPRCFVYPMI